MRTSCPRQTCSSWATSFTTGTSATSSCSIAKAYAALPPGGAFIAAENVIDDARRQNAFGLLMSLNMLIEFGGEGGFDYTGAQFDKWYRAAGFERTEVLPLTGPTSAATAYK